MTGSGAHVSQDLRFVCARDPAHQDDAVHGSDREPERSLPSVRGQSSRRSPPLTRRAQTAGHPARRVWAHSERHLSR
jgi:hypothetical protein